MSAPSSSRRLIRQTLTVARRDFVATVFTPTFLIFLLAPLLMISFGAVGGIGAASMADGAGRKVRIVALADTADGRALQAADRDLRALYRRGEAPPTLTIETPGRNPSTQAQSIFAGKAVDATAVLYGPLYRPFVLYKGVSERHADYLARLAEEVLRGRRLGSEERLSLATKRRVAAPADGEVSAAGRNQAAFFSVVGIFLLTIMLASQAVATIAEERSNKVIEVLAAAVPLESVFLGKLVGMFGVAVLFIAFWGTIVVNVGKLLPAEAVRAFADVGPAVGAPAFVLLFFAYFTMAYMLLGAVFLGIGAQASTPREIQMLSLPITIFQFAMFGLSQAAAARPDSTIARVAEIVPFSSPFAMAAYAANKAELWPHAIALLWQLGWVALTIFVGARLFRRGVLQSGSPKLRLRRAAIDNDVS